MKTYYVHTNAAHGPVVIKADSSQVADGSLGFKVGGKFVAVFAPEAWSFFTVEEEANE